MEDMIFSDTALLAEGEYIMYGAFGHAIDFLTKTKDQIVQNWEGDTTDINDIISRINVVIDTLQNKLDPAIAKLGQGAYYLSTTLNQVSSADVETGAANVTTGEAGGTAGGSSSKPGFWAYHGQDFANDWDYSGCDSGLDYIGATVSGLCGTVGSAANFLVDGASEIIGWIFG